MGYSRTSSHMERTVTPVVYRFGFLPGIVALGYMLAIAGAAWADAPPAGSSEPSAVQEKSADKKPPPKKKKEVKAPAPPTATAAPHTSSEDAGAAARERLRRCQLHPGTCVQGGGGADAHYPREQ
jgi:hypothetical protein